MLVPSSNLTMEAELPRMLALREAVIPDQNFVFHSARMRMKHVTPAELVNMNAQTERATAELADISPDVVASACLVAIMAQGPGHHKVAEETMGRVLVENGQDASVVSSAGALVEALRHTGAHRVAVVAPYMKPLTATVIEYLESEGFEVVDSLSLEVSDNLAVARLNPQNLLKHWRKLDLTNADALVLSACVQMPSLPVVAEVEKEAGIPVITAATATVFSILQSLGLEPVVPDAGSLLAGDR